MSRYCSILLYAAVIILTGLGLVMLMSTGMWATGQFKGSYHFLIRQSQMVGLGLVAAMFAAWFPVENLRKLAPYMYGVICLMLILCFVPGVGTGDILGSKRWIVIPLVGQFQPSEPAKLVTLICLATWFARWQTEVHTFWRGFVIPGIIVGIPTLLILVETDVGSALSLSLAVAAVLFCVGTRLIYLVPTALTAGGAVMFYLMNNANRWGRIEAWMNLEEHKLSQGMQQWRALLALGNGGPWGVGLGNGVEKFGTLTFAHIDFIFPVIGEELGLPFTLGVVLCYVLIGVGGCGIALQANTIFSRCVALGLTCLIVIPAIQNIAVTTALLPNDGLPLPFVSYGGTNLVFSLAAVGMLVGIHRRSQVRVPVEYPLTKQTRLAVKL
ncbi:FtsW/RodA/SpoVE family cell cycle protein [Luteolibacter yonseiensis]|uniref:Probable peptidoglycan glycosyltransferase FtsW n=1 Tax=Luteolibacter yonseiensis TaxID=1144680 RepID=A0A934VAG8_9BACT|nr:FtsW/RodA/SpoVE family cell cycle protein [Luteolibacter yonseiensis]MBK1814359.1 FtsW/RodA/SpoVE family cell cycle protein [Luteolibacter yonseiensis]